MLLLAHVFSHWRHGLGLACAAGLAFAAPEAAEAAIKYKRQGASTLGAPDVLAQSAEACEYYADRVWVAVEGVGDCIAFYPTPGAHGAVKAVVFFEGDIPSSYHRDADKLDAHLARLRSVLEIHARSFRVPFIFVARPGTFGSTGDHRRRREAREYHVLNAALDRIRERLAIGSYVVTGQSGGATAAAAMLVLGRTDIACATPGSGGYDVKGLFSARWADGAGDRSDPGAELIERMVIPLFSVADHVGRIAADPKRRIFVVGDPADKVTPFVYQQQFAERVRAAGHHAVIMRAEGRGSDHHGLAGVALRLAGLCAAGRPDAEIVAAAGGGARPSLPPERPRAR